MKSLSFFQFMSNLEQLESRILKAWSVILTFSLIVTFYLTKTEITTKIFLIHLSHLLVSIKVLFLPKNANFLHKDSHIRKIKRVLVLKDWKFCFLKLHYMWVYLRTIFQVSRMILKGFRREGGGVGNFIPLLTAKQTPTHLD